MTQIPWGPVGYLTYKRTYSRRLDATNPNSPTEEYQDTVNRIVEACDSQLGMSLYPEEKEAVRNIHLQMKGSVAGRFLWQLGSPTVDKLGLFSLQNCAGIVVDSPIEPFTWTMDALMLGSGVGYNIQKEHVYSLPKLKGPVEIVRKDTPDADFIVPDSREGWVELLRRVLLAHWKTGKGFSYSTMLVRGKGAAIKGFGGLASGPEELCWGMSQINQLLNKRARKKLNPIDALDLMNIIGYVVVAGNVRRSAQLAIGDFDDMQFLNAKRWDLGGIPNWRAMSNNSVVCNEFGKLPEQFWQGYQGNGEPYGLINMKLSRLVGRAGETQYPDQKVMVYNPCVAGDTPVLTSEGNIPIVELVGKKVNVWNGEEWSLVTPRVTGNNQPMLSITLSSGVTLRTTKTHRWILKDGTRIQAQHLTVGDKLIKATYPVIDGGQNAAGHMYTQGFYAGDGIEGKNEIFLYSPKYVCENRLQADRAGKEYPTRNPKIKRRVLRPTCGLFEKTWVPADATVLVDKLTWLAGLCDADATQTKDGSIQLSSIDRVFLSKIQLMLTTCGVSSKISIMHKKGFKDLPGGNYHCQTSYRLHIPAAMVKFLYESGMVCERLDLGMINPNRDASRFLEVVSIEESGIEETVYCFTEPGKNQGVFNGILTGQCAEQSLEDGETCALAEVFLPNAESKEDLFNTVSYLYKIVKHSLNLPCHQPLTEKVVHQNMRMGIGMTGIMQASPEQLGWLDATYQRLREFDLDYSKKHNFNPSIKLTTIKPSGTMSLLPGVTPGCHPAFSQYYIRRIRVAANSPLINTCISNGYHVEPQFNFDGTPDTNTFVVSFPCAYPSGTKLAKHVSATEQLDMVRYLQRNWSDNSVSCTVYYKKEELPFIQSYLTKHYDQEIKTCSFLLHQDHGFKQAPYEEISEQEYQDMKSKVKEITSMSDTEVALDSDCEGGACPVR